MRKRFTARGCSATCPLATPPLRAIEATREKHHQRLLWPIMSDNEEAPHRQLQTYTAPQEILDEFAQMADDDNVDDAFAEVAKSKQIAARQNDYHLRRFNREDALAAGEEDVCG